MTTAKNYNIKIVIKWKRMNLCWRDKNLEFFLGEGAQIFGQRGSGGCLFPYPPLVRKSLVYMCVYMYVHIRIYVYQFVIFNP